MIETQEQLAGQRLAEDEIFHFACHRGLACFNTCCAHKRLPVLPYDLLRLRWGLGLKSPQVLERYLELEMDPVSGWPVLRLRLDDQGRCPLVSDQDCTIYGHRPAACRTYPLAREVPACLGWQEEHPLTVEAWQAD